MFVSALPDPTCNSEKSANGGNKQILLLLLLLLLLLPKSKDKVEPQEIYCTVCEHTLIDFSSILSSNCPSGSHDVTHSRALYSHFTS